MRKATIALLPTDQRIPGLRSPFRDALAAESRPHASGSRVASVPVLRDGTYTLACCTSWPLGQALIKARLA